MGEIYMENQNLDIKSITEGKFDKGFIKDCGMELISYGDGECKCKISIEDRHLNPYGTVHGGVLYALADTTGGTAAISAAKMNVVTLTGNMNYIGPASSKEIIASAEVIHLGKTTVVVDVMIATLEGKDVAKATMTYYKV